MTEQKSLNDIYEAISLQNMPFYKRAEVLVPALVVLLPLVTAVAIQWGVAEERMANLEKRLANVEHADTQQWRRINQGDVTHAEMITSLRSIDTILTKIDERLNRSNVASR